MPVNQATSLLTALCEHECEPLRILEMETNKAPCALQSPGGKGGALWPGPGICTWAVLPLPCEELALGTWGMFLLPMAPASFPQALLCF